MKQLLLYLMLSGYFLSVISCSEDKGPEPKSEPEPTMLKLIIFSEKDNSKYRIVYYDNEKRCRLLNEEPEEYEGYKHLYSGNFFPLPEDIIFTELYAIRDSIVRTGPFEGYYVSFRLDTVYPIKRNRSNIIEIKENTREIEVDRQNPYEYPELMSDKVPGWNAG